MTEDARGRAFQLDRFQREAIAAVDRDHNVLVAAPTGAGKTVVAEHAVARALRAGDKAFYTTPIKALSNQKHRDLVHEHGPDSVGLLTGDTSRNPQAPAVVMTTEVLRNMVYRGAAALDGLRWVVLDEVHFLQDAYRGPVWEEVMIHLPPEVRLVCLSATVSNADELGEWITAVRGPTDVVVERTRPVALTDHYLVEDRERDELVMLPTLVGRRRPNPDGDRFDDQGSGPRRRGRPRRRYATPRRLEVVDRLAGDGLLPAIYFVFSRAGCDDAVRSWLSAGLGLTTADERERIAELVEHHTASLEGIDRRVLEHDRWLAALQSGVAAHHAGMVPPQKEAVEACFAEGLVKVVFATETLALGINMPARTVVVEKLSKFSGESHQLLTPAQYSQLTGRAGRRGIDDHGHAVVLWSPFVPFSTVASLAASRRFVLTSAFRPTYNMAANLVRRHRPADAHRMLNLSFAQFQTDQAVVRLELDLEERRAAVERDRAALVEQIGADGLARLLGDDEPEPPADDERQAVRDAVAALEPGDVVAVPVGRRERRRLVDCAVLSVAHRSGGIRLRTVDASGEVRTATPTWWQEPPEPVGHVALPVPFAPTTRAFQREVARRLVAAGHTGDGGPGSPTVDGGGPDVERAVRRLRRGERAIASLERQIGQRSASLSQRFDVVVGLLDAWGYLDGWRLTDKGERLASIYHECDLLVAEVVSEGLLDGLDPPSLAGIASLLTYEHRSAAPPPAPWFPSARAEGRAERIAAVAAELATAERDAGLPPTRAPDPTFVAQAHAWAAGADLDVVLEDEELSPGDFVRNVKQLIDLLRQLAVVAPSAPLTDACRAAVDGLARGVVTSGTDRA